MCKKKCDIDDDGNENEKTPIPCSNGQSLFFGMKKMPWTWIALVLPSFELFRSRVRFRSFSSNQDGYYRARATIDAKIEKKSELADSVAGKEMCVMSVVMFTGILPVLWWSCAIYLRGVGSVVIK